MKTALAPLPAKDPQPTAGNPPRRKGAQQFNFRDAHLMALKALKLAEHYGTPPVPTTFEVWYAYAVGDHPELHAEIRAMIENGGDISNYVLEQLHEKYLRNKENSIDRDIEMSDQLDTEMTAIKALVSDYLQVNERFSGSLSDTEKSLTNDNDAKSIREIVQDLIRQNETMRAETSTMATRLNDTQDRLTIIQNELSELRVREMQDALTGVFNRRYLDKRLKIELAAARETDKPLSLVIADIDHFKGINDTYGHTAGDGVLKHFAKLLRSNMKGKDMVARYGGEEFCIILPQTALDNAVRVSEQIRQELEDSTLVLAKSKKKLQRITASFGVALSSPDDTETSLFERADKRLYEAKNSGRNRVKS